MKDALDQEEALAVFAAFDVDGDAVSVAPLGEGLINRTLLVSTKKGQKYVLQCLNTTVFPRPRVVMENLVRILEHLHARQRPALTLVGLRLGGHYLDHAGVGTWRCFRYISGSRTHSISADPQVLRAAAAAFGGFIADLDNLGAPPLEEVIAGFHDTSARFAALERAVVSDRRLRGQDAAVEIAALLERRELAALLDRAAAAGDLPRRNVHNDTKLGNLLFDGKTGQVLAVIDLDTVMPGFVVHDFGDLVRSAAASGRETDSPQLDLTRYSALVEGYLDSLAGMLTPAEHHFMPLSPRVLTLELTLRFLADHLDGDAYFLTDYPGQNLDRCRSQLALLVDMDTKQDAMRRIWQTACACRGL